MDIENDKVSYYVIADLSTWAENSPERSKQERFDSISEAMEAFRLCHDTGSACYDCFLPLQEGVADSKC